MFAPALNRAAPSADIPETMAASDESWAFLFAGLQTLKENWPVPDWTYDRRLKCVVSSFPKAIEDEVRATMGPVLQTVFNATTLASAPDAVRALATACGGLRSSQLLFWGGDTGAPGAFGLWWPWGDGTTVSLRIGLHDVDIPKERYPKLRDIFGIPQAPPPT